MKWKAIKNLHIHSRKLAAILSISIFIMALTGCTMSGNEPTIEDAATESDVVEVATEEKAAQQTAKEEIERLAEEEKAKMEAKAKDQEQAEAEKKEQEALKTSGTTELVPVTLVRTVDGLSP